MQFDKPVWLYCVYTASSGRCRAIKGKFYYDETTNTCKRFIWGGCGGNGNKFSTEKSCMDMCSTENESNPTTDGTDGTTEERMRTTDTDAKEYVDYEFDPWFLYYYNYY